MSLCGFSLVKSISLFAVNSEYIQPENLSQCQATVMNKESVRITTLISCQKPLLLLICLYFNKCIAAVSKQLGLKIVR